MSELDTQLTLTAAHSNGLLSKYKSRWSRLHRAANLISYGYLVAGLGLPVGGTVVSISIIVGWLSTLIKVETNQNIGNIGTALFWIVGGPAALLASLWLLMTPLALIVLLAQRRYIGLLPPLFVAIWFGIHWGTVSMMRFEDVVWLDMFIFAVGAFFGTKINVRQMKQIRDEPSHCQPKVLGCGAGHEESPTPPA